MNPADRLSARCIAAVGALIAALLAAYGRTFAAPFVFDDFEAIVHNPTQRHLWPLADALAPPRELGSTVGGRPMLNLSFALNHAVSGEAVWSYHATNLAIHIGSALLLFGLCRRFLVARGSTNRVPPSSSAPLWALAISAGWALHPLHTGAVTYLSQRAESLAGFFYLLTLYAFVRGTPPGSPSAMPRTRDRVRHSTEQRAWLAVSALACLLGVATKEIVATAPVLVLLFETVVARRPLAQVLRARWAYYLALLLSWALVAALVAGTQNRGGTAGFGIGVPVWTYLLTQGRAIVHYLRLAVWPDALVFDYGTSLVRGFAEVWPQALLVTGLLAASLTALVRWPRIAFAGVAFFLLLAPSSSVVPIASQTMAEHRMYLPLAALAVLAALAADRCVGPRGAWLGVLLAAAGGVLTWQRNEVYRSDVALWQDTVARAPENARAHNNLGNALVTAGRIPEAVTHYERAVTLEPQYADAQSNLGHVFAVLGRPAEAVTHAETAVALKPDSGEVWMNYGLALSRANEVKQAVAAFQKAIVLSPSLVDAKYDLGNAHYQAGEFAAAVIAYENVLHQEPRHHHARFNLAFALLQVGRPRAALEHFETLIEQNPRDATAQVEAAHVLAGLGRNDEAIAHLERALAQKPDLAEAQTELARLKAGATR